MENTFIGFYAKISDWNEKQKLYRGPSKEPAKLGSNWPSGFEEEA
jgi:hypothetical protein